MSKIDLGEHNPAETRSMRAGAIPRGAKVLAALRSVAQLGYAPPIPPEDRVLVVDISHWNGEADLAVMRAAGVAAFYQKATEGVSNWVDRTYETRRAQAQALGYPFGLFHFLRPVSGVNQARTYLDKTTAGRGILPHTVDVEVPMPAWIVREYVANIHAELGYYPVVYTSHYCWSLVIGTEDKAWVSQRCPGWFAHWNGGNTGPLIPSGWSTYVMHQFSADGNRRGAEFGCTGEELDIDLDWGRRSWLEQYVPPEPVQPVSLDEWAVEMDAWARGAGYNGPRPGAADCLGA